MYQLPHPHPSIVSAGPSPYEVTKALVQVLFLSGRYRTEKLCRFWSSNPNGYCLGPLCRERSVVEDEEHILLQCRSLATTRQNLLEFTISYARLYLCGYCIVYIKLENHNEDAFDDNKDR